MGASSDLEFKGFLTELLSNVDYSELITVEREVPHIRPMVYVNRGLTIYMASLRGANKVKQIKANPHVSVIIKTFKEDKENNEIIVEGLADFVSDPSEREWVFSAFKSKPLTFQEWAEDGSSAEYEVIRIVPRLIKYFDYTQGESAPRVLEVL